MVIYDTEVGMSGEEIIKDKMIDVCIVAEYSGHK